MDTICNHRTTEHTSTKTKGTSHGHTAHSATHATTSPMRLHLGVATIARAMSVSPVALRMSITWLRVAAVALLRIPAVVRLLRVILLRLLGIRVAVAGLLVATTSSTLCLAQKLA